MSSNPNPDQRHRERMRRKKEVVDAAIARADRDQGLLLVLTGNGKGKSSSAFGMAARALGHGLKVGVAQFIKGTQDTGEEAFFRRQPGVTWQVLGEGFTWETQDRARDAATARRGWEQARAMLRDPDLAHRPRRPGGPVPGRGHRHRHGRRQARLPCRRAGPEGDRPVTGRPCPALFIAAPASGQGKTTVTAALARRHRDLGRRVRVFKTGPDFLDPLILERASGAPSRPPDPGTGLRGAGLSARPVDGG